MGAGLIMTESVEFSKFVFDSDEAAILALENIGGTVDRRLSMTATYPVVGTIRRHFAILGNATELDGMVANDAILFRIQRTLRSPENAKVLEKLEEGLLNFTPCNKRLVRRVVASMHGAGVHLPWAFKMMNFDFGMTISKVQGVDSCYGFSAFYNNLIRMNESNGEVMINFVRLFSLPINDIAGGTWMETISEEVLDEDLALIIEANSRA
jgi:hypothetical protein